MRKTKSTDPELILQLRLFIIYSLVLPLVFLNKIGLN
jgi:hypothetical protein